MPPSDSEVDVLKSIEGKLDQLLRLTALQMASNMKQVQAIQTLSAAGFERKVIADLLGTTPNTVSVTLAKAKAKQRPRESPLIDPAAITPTME
jgi:DNA-binding NarL/FixJ family response regulator